MELARILNQFVYRIEAKPGGGFIATCNDPTLPPLEGATRSEVEQKIQESISAKLGVQMPWLKPFFDANQVKLHYHIDRKPDGGFIIHHGDANSSDAAHASSEDSAREKIEGLVQSKLFSTLMDRIPPELHQQIMDKLNSGGLDVLISRSVTTKTFGKADAASILNRAKPAAENPAVISSSSLGSETTSSSPISYEKSSSGLFLKIMLFLLVLGAIVFLLLHRA